LKMRIVRASHWRGSAETETERASGSEDPFGTQMCHARVLAFRDVYDVMHA
jgi:hypothetical protein